ncbi:MAG: type II toxin-antitoxin system YafQ family toxin [Anaerolineales bacterium]|uniref:Type II toxin-antitoxin system YafQ family toxin n=1 Tax=Candidatus Desulfolinea nitratireducens TaxID=2841698 RepID=A0A8J6TJW1_9CHLR|nr:type II toxin-antitoxin system YafQ family toxin [Candidatus Desulfolinea nitratireducens]MBL6961799.1 type II toxin-antitoxin system YafQ family toxin [Anaerolineales bacterium]
MKTPRRTSQLKKDVKRMGNRGNKFEVFKEVIRKLVAGESLDSKYRDHLLVGQYKGTRECHIEPDWLLIYEVNETELLLVRTGTHSDLFK